MKPDLSRDDGASLVLVLAFVLVLSVVLVAVADQASGSLRSTAAVRDVRAQNHVLDAAVNGAIQQVRGDMTQGLAPGFTNNVNTCGTFNAPADPSGTLVTVSCGGEQSVQGQADSGGTVPVNNPLNKPSEALFATARSPEPGITLDANGVFRVHGGVYSSSSIAVSNAELRVEGDVVANGACTGSITSLGPPYPPAGTGTPQALQCNSGAPLSPEVYPAAAGSPPPTQTAPSCPAGYLATLQPGTYTNANALSALTSGGCTGKILWFKPGVYLFNFAGANHEWSIGDATSNIIGGTPFGWNPASATRPVIPQADAGNPLVHSCVTDEDAVPPSADPANLGVQFIFTGDSRMNITATGGNVELCAQPDANNQQIAIYGVPKIAGNESAGTVAPRAVASPSGFAADMDPKGLVIDGTTSVTTIDNSTGASPLTKQVTLTGFDQLDPATLPDTARITSVKLKVAHLEAPNNGAIGGVSAAITGADGAVGAPVGLTPCFGSIAACTESVDVTKYLGTVAKLRSAAGTGPKVTYAVTAAKNKTATATVDGMQLDVTWVPTGLDATAATSTSTPAFTGTNGALTPDDGSVASAALGKNATASIRLDGFNQLTTADLPAGVNITKVLARVVHRDDTATGGVALGGKTAAGVAFPDQAVAKCSTSLLECTQYVDLTSALGSEAKLRAISGGVTTGPTLTYKVTQSNAAAGTAVLDGIQLLVVYQPGGLGTASGCVTVTPYDPSNNATCPVMGAHGNKAFVSIHGTIYAPGDAFDLKIMNGGTTVFGRGAIARSLRLFFNPSVVYNGDNVTVRTPDDNAGVIHRERVVDFWACLGRVTCTDMNALLHAVVAFTDQDPVTNAVTPGLVASVKSWARRR